MLRSRSGTLGPVSGCPAGTLRPPSRQMKWALLSPLAALLLATTVRGAGPFGLALSPPMGWRSWNAYGADVSQAKLTAGMDAMATKKRLLLAPAAGGGAAEASLVDLGYVHFGLDDAWQACGTGVNISGKASYYSAEGEPLINTTCVHAVCMLCCAAAARTAD